MPVTNNKSVKKVLPLVLATAIFMQLLDSTILNTSLPAIAKDLNESALDMQDAIISYVLTLALFTPISGYFADKFGTRKVFIIALFLFSAGSLFCALSTSLRELVIFRVVQGLGGSMMIPVGKLALIKTFNKNELVPAMNYAVIPALIGPVLGPLVGGYLVDYLSWHWIFLINIPIGIMGIILGYFYMPDFSSDVITFDLKGFLLFAAGSLVLSVALEYLGNSMNITPVLVMLVAGFLMLYFYYQHAKKDANAIFPLNLFKIRTFRVGILGNLITRIGISSIPLLLPLMIQVAYGQSAVVSGWIVAPMALTGILAKYAVIPVLNKMGYRKVLMSNTIIIGLLICALAIPGVHQSIYWYIPVIAVLGFFNSVQFTAMNSISVADLRNFNVSSGNSLLAVNQQLAIGVGITFGMLTLKIFQSKVVSVTDGTAIAFKYSFLVIGILTVVSGAVFRRLHFRDGDNLKTV